MKKSPELTGAPTTRAPSSCEWLCKSGSP